MIICPRCGTKNNDNFNCCYNCGTPLNKQSNTKKEGQEDEAATYEQEQEEIYDAPVENEPEEYSEEPDEYDDSSEDEDISSVYSSSAYRNQQTIISPSSKKSGTSPKTPKKKRNEVYLSRAIALAVVLLIVIIVIWGTIKLLDHWFSGPIKPTDTPTPDASTHDPYELNAKVFSHYDTDINGDKFFKVTVQTNGDKVFIMNKEYPVENGEASMILTQYDIYRTYRPSYIQKGEKFDAEIPVTVRKEGYQDYTYKFTLKDITTPMVPFELISPTELNAIIYKTNTTISFQTQSGSRIYINGDEFTDTNFNSDSGIFSMDILTPPSEDPYRYEVTIESDEYLTRTFLYELTRSSDHDPEQTKVLELDNILWTAGADNTVKITGKFTGAQADLQFYGVNTQRVETLSITFDEDGNGSFEAVLECTLLGWTEILVECKTDLGIHETIYVKNLSDSLGGIKKITTTSWGINTWYNELVKDETKLAGQWFVIGLKLNSEDSAVIKDITKVETGYALTVNITPSKDYETLIWVELCTDTITKNVGDKVKIFANRSLSYEGMPRFLAVKVI